MDTEKVWHLGIASLRILTAQRLRELDELVVVHCHSEPLAVVIRYDEYLKLQKLLQAVADCEN